MDVCGVYLQVQYTESSSTVLTSLSWRGGSLDTTSSTLDFQASPCYDHSQLGTVNNGEQSSKTARAQERGDGVRI